MSKQKEQAAAPAEQEQKFENEKFDAALHELQCLEAGLNIDKASEQTKFFLHEIKKRLKQATNRTFITYEMASGLQAEDFAAHRQHILTDREMYERAREWYG